MQMNQLQSLAEIKVINQQRAKNYKMEKMKRREIFKQNWEIERNEKEKRKLEKEINAILLEERKKIDMKIKEFSILLKDEKRKLRKIKKSILNEKRIIKKSISILKELQK